MIEAKLFQGLGPGRVIVIVNGVYTREQAVDTISRAGFSDGGED